MSAIAIVITLIYLAIQTQPLAQQTELNTVTLQASSRQAVLQNSHAILSYTIVNPAISLNQVKPDLTDTEKAQLSASLFALVDWARTNWRQYEADALDAEGWRSVEVTFVANLRKLQPRKRWNFFFAGRDTTFVSHIDSLLADREVVTENLDLRAFD